MFTYIEAPIYDGINPNPYVDAIEDCDPAIREELVEFENEKDGYVTPIARGRRPSIEGWIVVTYPDGSRGTLWLASCHDAPEHHLCDLEYWLTSDGAVIRVIVHDSGHVSAYYDDLTA